MLTKSFRLTVSEASRLQEQMRAEDYTNLSKYIRSKVFGNRITVRKPKDLSSEEIRAMLNSVRERISGFGADYNRIVSHLLGKIDEPGQRNMAEVNKRFSVSSKVDFHQSGIEKGTRERVRSKVTKFGYHYKFLSSF